MREHNRNPNPTQRLILSFSWRICPAIAWMLVRIKKSEIEKNLMLSHPMNEVATPIVLVNIHQVFDTLR
jgi:hypothetical protein